MGQTPENKGSIYAFGKFVLDPQERVLRSDGRSIHLTDKLFDTLLLMVEHNGRLLTKDEMMATLWEESYVEESNLAKNISRLRKILNSNGTQYIETLPKRGYRFAAEVKQIDGAADLLIQRRMSVKITQETEIVQPVPLRSRRRTGVYLTTVFVLVFGLLAAGLYFNRSADPAGSKINSIAVLPLKSLTSGENSLALGLGLTDALISTLGSMRTITVRPTSAVAKFAALETDAIEIGRRLNVDAVLEGTIQQADGRLRVNARLLRVSSGEQIWTEKFDGAASELFALQDDLSNKIAKTLFFELSGAEKRQLVRRQTENVEAYEKYLRGRFYQNQNTVQGLKKAIEFYEQAIGLDRQFADAHAGLADALLILYNFSLMPPDEIVPRAKQAIERALQLNPNLSDAYSARALIQFLSERNWPAAETSLQKALELNPKSADAYLRYGYFLTANGRFEDAQEKLEIALQLNPLSPIVKTDIGLNNLCARRYSTAIEQLEKVVADNPEVSLPRWFLGSGYDANNEPVKAFEVYMSALEREGGGDLAAKMIAVQRTGGLQAAYRMWIDESLKMRNQQYFPAVNIAFAYAAIKDRENTLIWLEKSLNENEPTFWQIKYSPIYDFLRNEVRFQKMLQAVNL